MYTMEQSISFNIFMPEDYSSYAVLGGAGLKVHLDHGLVMKREVRVKCHLYSGCIIEV